MMVERAKITSPLSLNQRGLSNPKAFSTRDTGPARGLYIHRKMMLATAREMVLGRKNAERNRAWTFLFPISWVSTKANP